MLLKVSLIVAILAGLGTLVISQLQVAEKITELKTQYQTTSNELTTTKDSEAKARQEAKAAKSEADKTKKELVETAANLESASAKATSQETRANRAEGELNTARGELTAAQRDLAAWKALGRPVEQIEKSLADLVKANIALEALGEEKRVMNRELGRTKQRLAIYEADKDIAPDLPQGLKGKVVAVDAKWDFVVLDIGSKQGLVERGVLLVNREGKLVAKLRVTTVDAERSIANVLPEWKQADVMAGDVVLY